jgi:pimeloyl-ACP methyl ester carboxylesterase
MSAILLDGSIVHYEVLGRGRPIIFLHGWVGSWRYWISSMQVASTLFRAYAVDLWGYGETTHEAGRYSLEDQTVLLELFLEEMGIGKVALVGHGLGGLVSLAFTAKKPQSVDRVMAINCPLTLEAVNSRLQTAPLADLVDWLSNHSPESASALSDASKADPLAISTSINSFQSDNLFQRVSRTIVPCLLVHGQNDPAISMPPLEQIFSLPLNMHQVILEESGHFPMIDESARFHRLLTDFLALDSGASPQDLQLKEEWKRRVR